MLRHCLRSSRRSFSWWSSTPPHKRNKLKVVSKEDALEGRESPIFAVNPTHMVTGNPMFGPFPDHLSLAMFGMGCFWGIETLYYMLDGMYSTQCGYAGGYTKNPTYKEVCNNDTGHIEVVRLVYDSTVVSYAQLLKLFWENHDPTQGMRQGWDVGTQYRSAIFYYSENQRLLAMKSKDEYQKLLGQKKITTQILEEMPFWMAEDYHQQYFHKNSHLKHHCGTSGLGIECPLPSLDE